jgi:tetratricopeptide (TPR) repeat protein
MKKNTQKQPPDIASSLGWLWMVGLGCVVILLFLLVGPHGRNEKAMDAIASADSVDNHVDRREKSRPAAISHRQRGTQSAERLATEVVAEKLNRYAGNHLELARAVAKQHKITIPPAVSEFFAAVQAGNWEQTTNLFSALQKLRGANESPEGFEAMMQPIKESFGVAEQAHEWPAQSLLDYGNAILDSLKPGMVYVGGTDAGRFIPSLLTETGEAPSHIVLTQNALADSSYLEYLRFRYGDQMKTLSAEDSQNSFQSYLQDAQRRLKHDEEFPTENKQILPGENVQMSEGRFQVSGGVAVMQINGRLLQGLLEKNPDLAFGLEESAPLTSFYSGATTLGPITELRGNAASPLTADQAAQSLDYWRNATQSLLADPDSASSDVSRDAYARLVIGQANLFSDHKFSSEAEQAYQMATGLDPALPEAVNGYVQMLTKQKRFDEARQIVQNALDRKPDDAHFRELLAQLNK